MLWAMAMPFGVVASSLLRPIGLFFCSSHFTNRSNYACRAMGQEVLISKTEKQANFRLCKVSNYVTELLEIHADEPSCHVIFIPGNPGVVTFYKDFLESLFEILRGRVSLTAVGHISHTMKDWEHGRLFSLQDQIDQKVNFINQELKNNEVPILLVGHSIGVYISIETFKRVKEKVLYCIGIYPCLALNLQSRKQHIIWNVAKCSIVSVALSSIVGLLGLLPIRALKFIMSQSVGKKWSSNAIEASCSHLPKYHTVRNMLFMAMTEYGELSEGPDWGFMSENQNRFSFLFGIDDHWGPLQMFEEISRRVPQIALSIEREGHTHSFCCTEEGSSWVAHHVATLISDQISRSSLPAHQS